MNKHGFRWIWLPTRLAIYARDSWQCLACGLAGAWKKGRGKWNDCRPQALSLDHVIRKEDGGSNDASNLVTLCVSCNASRGAVSIEVWKPEIVDRVAIAITTPIDAALGRELARQLDPKYMLAKAQRDRLRDRRVPARRAA